MRMRGNIRIIVRMILGMIVRILVWNCKGIFSGYYKRTFHRRYEILIRFVGLLFQILGVCRFWDSSATHFLCDSELRNPSNFAFGTLKEKCQSKKHVENICLFQGGARVGRTRAVEQQQEQQEEQQLVDKGQLPTISRRVTLFKNRTQAPLRRPSLPCQCGQAPGPHGLFRQSCGQAPGPHGLFR